ncbi:MAG TPA: hypothetical protein PKI53_11895 [Candidatus Aminicenantes bacterium]|nr:hypothetical protein [Candidatus Aminicenantes bacterium]HNT33130.1 hypothetical protein [Candidatus Aminicenantes bacterium]
MENKKTNSKTRAGRAEDLAGQIARQDKALALDLKRAAEACRALRSACPDDREAQAALSKLAKRLDALAKRYDAPKKRFPKDGKARSVSN